MDIKYWIYILDEPDTFSVVDMIEHTGTAYLPQQDEMKMGIESLLPHWNMGQDCFIASLSRDWMLG